MTSMMTSSNGNIFRVTGHLCPVNSPHKGGALMFSLICVWIDGWVKNRKAGDYRRYRAHYDVTVMSQRHFSQMQTFIEESQVKNLLWKISDIQFRGQFGISMSSYHYRNPHHKDNKALRPSHIYYRNNSTGEKANLYWINHHVSMYNVAFALGSLPINALSSHPWIHAHLFSWRWIDLDKNLHAWQICYEPYRFAFLKRYGEHYIAE